MQASKLRRVATIQQKSVSQDSSYGSEQIAWTTFATVRAEVRDTIADERVSDSVRTLTRRTVVVIRWLSGLTSDMRITLDDGRVFQIVSIAELPKKVGWTILCEQYSA